MGAADLEILHLRNLLRTRTTSKTGSFKKQKTARTSERISENTTAPLHSHQPKKFEGGPPVFVVHGQVHHLTQNGQNGEKPLYSQLYFLDPEFAVDERMKNPHNKACKKEIMQRISETLLETNPYAKAFKMMKQLIEENEDNYSTIRMWITKERQNDPRRYNLPVANEVAAVFSTDDGEPPFKRDIAIHPLNSSELQRINIISPNCDPMIYPLLFPTGEPGWQPGMAKNQQQLECNENVSSLVSNAQTLSGELTSLLSIMLISINILNSSYRR